MKFIFDYTDENHEASLIGGQSDSTQFIFKTFEEWLNKKEQYFRVAISDDQKIIIEVVFTRVTSELFLVQLDTEDQALCSFDERYPNESISTSEGEFPRPFLCDDTGLVNILESAIIGHRPCPAFLWKNRDVWDEFLR